jgi:hypothetical protein
MVISIEEYNKEAEKNRNNLLMKFSQELEGAIRKKTIVNPTDKNRIYITLTENLMARTFKDDREKIYNEYREKGWKVKEEDFFIMLWIEERNAE